MRKFFSLIAAVLFAGSMMASVITLDPAEQTPQTTETDISLTIDGIDIAYHGTLNATVTYETGTVVPADFRVYANNTLTLSAEYNITKVVIAGKTNAKDWAPSVSAGTITTGASYASKTEKAELSDPLFVVEDIDAQTITITCNKQLRAYLIEITIDDPTTRKITLVTGPWDDADAKFAAATLPIEVDSASANMMTLLQNADKIVFSDFFDAQGGGVYEGVIPADAKTIAFGRFNPETTAPITIFTLQNSNLLWNFSNVLALDPCLKYNIYKYGETGQPSLGFWGDDEVSYFLTGTFNNWATGDVNYLFKENLAAEGEWRLNTNIEKGAGVKVVGVHSKYSSVDWYPDGTGNEFVANNVYGDVTVYFRPDGQGNEDWYEGYFIVVPQEGQQEVNVIAERLFYDDLCADEEYRFWQIYGKNADYYIYISNLESTTAPGTYNFEDLDYDWTFLVPKTSPADTIRFAAGSVELVADGENANLTGTLVGEDAILYHLNYKGFAEPLEETLTITDAEFGDLYQGIFSVGGTAEDQTYVRLSILSEQHEGEYTDEDLDYEIVGSYIETPDGELQEIESADITITSKSDECSIVRANVLCYNNVLYHITMKIGDCPEEQKDYYEVAEAIAAVGAQEIVDDDVIAVRGIISKIQIKGKNFDKYHSACIYVSDATGAEGEFEFFNCVSLDDAIFASCDPAHDNTSTSWVNLNSLTDANGIVVAVGDEVIAQGKFLLYKNSNTGAIIAYELAQGCKLIKVRDIEEGIEDIVATGAAAKVLRDNQILILKGDKVYNVFGTRVQ